MKRKSISKSVRFSIFSRDGFTCKYCGRQSDEVKLVIDHIDPVANGGTNDETNLITSCESCNQGKAAKLLPDQNTIESHRLSLAQEFQEQNDIHKKAVESARKSLELRQEICNYYCQLFGVETMQKTSLNHYVSICKNHGSDALFAWLQIASDKLSHRKEVDILRYVHGIKRKCIEEGL